MFYSLDIPIEDILARISPVSLFIFFGIFAILVTVISLVLFYHWRKYSVYSPYIKKARTIYLVGIISLVASSFVALLTYL